MGGVLIAVGFAVTATLLGLEGGQSGNAVLFAVLTLIWVCDQVASRDVGALTPVLLWIGGFTQLVAAAVLLRYPSSALDVWGRWFVGVTAAILGAVQLAIILTGTRADWQTSELADGPWPTLIRAPALNDALWELRWIVWTVAGPIFLVLLVRRWRRLGFIERRTLSPILVTAGITTVMISLRLADDQLPGVGPQVMEGVRAYAAVAVSAAFALSALRMRLERGDVATLASDLHGPVSIEEVRDALRRALGDPGLEVWFWVPEQDTYVDAAGAAGTLPDPHDRLLAFVSDSHGAPMAVVLTDISLERHHQLVDAAVAVSRLALENARLQASLRARLVEVRTIQTRLVHTGLEERRRLERNLHDGAQQRLLGLGMRLGALANTVEDPETTMSIDAARVELQHALEELRDLARGLYPVALTQSGLASALEAVTERLPLEVTRDVPDRRWPPDLESTAYFIACEAMSNACKHAGECTVRLRVYEKDNSLVVDVTDNGQGSTYLTAGGTVRGIRDRVEAAGGRLTVRSTVGVGTRLVAELPCG
ncbi:hypothetical protein GON03_03340 [Nocardioides sp. MAH-18]|uniref:histidine kinase n=1 Tax=Nocardioides agri TaxID=2682843 RepID=A0A6L6XMY4_9ACTN|nr:MULTISPECIES: histidine kinase [unclassified Nocardioides]MBA2953334.1 hypothetical protein [Nocardioides sp. CGMCC 1.13656]MVQ48202.1 hypothetical protein [Nocardioides sp. MAH-18]